MKKFWFIILSLFILCVGFIEAGYSEEFSSAYTRAFNNWITTQPTIDKANMNKSVTRIELSKMISNYAINILNKTPDTSKKCNFTDITDNQNTQYDLWVTKACQLWLMWQWITKFRPYDKVTRAEFWTILSRLLYWDKYNWWTPYYKKHLNQLNIRWIMTNINNPQWMELRWNVMVMLKRSQELWNYKIPSFDELDDIIYDKCPNGFEWSYDIVYRNSFIIPYKDWYIWYNYWWNWEWWGYYLTYKNLNDPCNNISTTDEIFFWYAYYKHYKELYNDSYNDNTYSDNKLYIAEWWRSWIPVDIVAKNLNCKAWEDPDICKNEVDKFMYNLIIWEENNEYFTQWMNKFKQDINNSNFTNYDFWQKKRENCSDKTNKEIEQLRNSLNWEEIEKLRSEKKHECIVEYLKN